MMRITRVGTVAVALGLGLPGCGDGIGGRNGDALRPDGEQDQDLDVEPLDLNAAFDDASEEFDVLTFFIYVMALLTAIVGVFAGWNRSKVSAASNTPTTAKPRPRKSRSTSRCTAVTG